MKKIYLLLFALSFLPTQASAAVFYVDFGLCSTGTHNGTASSTAFCSINEFANVARTAGDIAFVRRGGASTTNIVSTSFTTDGNQNNPITISADYDNIWPDSATSSVTWTPSFGSTFIASSASSTEFTTPNRWIYIQGDCNENYLTTVISPCVYAYEVSSTSPNGIDIFLPYKGNQTGAGNNMRVMLPAPVIGITTTNTQVMTQSSDDYWVVKGLDLRGTATACQITPNGRGEVFMDMILQGNGTSDCGMSGNSANIMVKKTRVFGSINGFNVLSGGLFEDILVDCNSVGSSFAFGAITTQGIYHVKDAVMKNCTNQMQGSATIDSDWYFSNMKRNNVFTALSGAAVTHMYYQDDQGVPGFSAQSSNQIGSLTTATTSISDVANLRAGGGPKNLQVIPPATGTNTGLSAQNFPWSYMKLFEYPMYANTSSKTYTMYFMSTSTTGWVINPITSTLAGSSTPELYIECEYFGASSGAARMLKRSSTASAVNFTGSTAWQTVAVTCQPAQTGILYLRGWYAKPKETTNNWFLMDLTPVVT